MLLAVPLNVAVLRALAEGPKRLVDLRREAGSPPQTTTRGYVRSLVKAGVIGQDRGGASASYELTASGRHLLEVSTILTTWLAHSPLGPLQLGSAEAKSAIKALVNSWSAGLVHALATRPLSLTELNASIASLSYPSLERRLLAMRLLGLVESAADERRSTPYTASDWLRTAAAPLLAAARWEHRRQPEQAPPITNRDVEVAFLLTLPLLTLPGEISGTCGLAVRDRNGQVNRDVGVIAAVRDGAVLSSATSLGEGADAWVLGSANAWLSAVFERDVHGLELSGEPGLAAGMVEGVQMALLLS